MPIQNSTTIMDTLYVHDRIEISSHRLRLAEVDNEGCMSISNTDTDTTYEGKNVSIYGYDSAALNSAKSVNITSGGDNVNIRAHNSIRLAGKSIKLPDSRTIYGTEDPNDLNLHDVEEGTIYFKLISD